MPFAPQIRKQVLQALEEHILPALKNAQILQVLAAPPFDLAPAEYWPVEQKYLSHKTPDPLQVAWHWKNERMSASRFPYMIFMYEGIADHKIGITTRMAKAIKKETGKTPSGSVVVRLPAPAMAYFSSAIPGYNGADPPYGDGISRSLCLSIMSQDVRFHLSESEPDKNFISHSLQIHDPLLVQMALLYGEELKIATKKNIDVAQAQLYVMMSRLHRQLQAHRAPLGNSAWATPLISKSSTAKKAKAIDWKLCQQTMDYIETRLNDNLNRTHIAKAMKVSPDHLGRVFHHTVGLTLMRYVTGRRMEAAKLILREGNENIAEIASLVGFTNAASFSAAFKQATGSVPREYRRQQQITRQ